MFAFMCWSNLGGLRSADWTKKVSNISIIDRSPSSLNQLDPNGVLIFKFHSMHLGLWGFSHPWVSNFERRKAWLVWLSLVTWDLRDWDPKPKWHDRDDKKMSSPSCDAVGRDSIKASEVRSVYTSQKENWYMYMIKLMNQYSNDILCF